jgi:catechol 2,3-dioxygenase-like lactoylglutathione lyase family enzyme
VIVGDPFQVGILVRELEPAVERHGGDWQIVENPQFSMRLALRGEQPQLELLQPLPGGAEILHDWLARRGEGLHHLGVRVDSLPEAIAEMEAAGYPLLLDGYWDGGGFAYFDTEVALGYLVEALQV